MSHLLAHPRSKFAAAFALAYCGHKTRQTYKDCLQKPLEVVKYGSVRPARASSVVEDAINCKIEDGFHDLWDLMLADCLELRVD